MIGRRHQHQLVVEQRRGDDSLGDLGGHRTERQVDAVVGEVVEQGPHTAGTQFELDVGVSGVERRERAREVERVERLDRADAHSADDGPGQRGEIGPRPVELASTRRARARNSAPACVSATWRVLRVSSVVPSSVSSLRICTDTAGWATCRTAAARPKPPSRTTASR